MFSDDPDPSETEYYDPKTEYEKMVVRQAMAMEMHPYRILSARISVDTASLMAFVRQDPRLEGQKEQRCEKQFHAVSHNAMQMFKMPSETVYEESEVDAVATRIIQRDKRGKEA